MKRKKIILPCFGFLIVAFLWQLLVQLCKISIIILPAPTDILTSIFQNFHQLFTNSLITLGVAVAGFVISGILAFLLSTIFHFSKLIKKMFLPLAISTRAIPIIAIAPIAVLWFGTGAISKIVLSAMISFFPILINLMKGITDFEADEIDLLNTFTHKKWRIYLKVRIPNSLPYLFAGLKVASSFSIIGAIVAEFVGSATGIGYLIKSSTYYSETELTFAAIVFAALCGLIFYGVIVIIQKKIVFWEYEV